MMYKYQVTEIDGHGVQVSHLDKQGADGWELCTIERTTTSIIGGGKIPVTHFYWKKRMPEDRVEVDLSKAPQPGGWVKPEDFMPPEVDRDWRENTLREHYGERSGKLEPVE